MKLNGIAGTGSGKLGSQVYASVGGEQIVRQYQSKVANPNTALQVNQRARLKLMSQLSAAFAPVIVIPKKGLKSSRNLFVKRNFELSSGNDGMAQLSIENIQLTSGTAGLPAIYLSRAGGAALTAKMVSKPGAAVSRICYIVYVKDADQQLRYVTSKIVTEAGEDGLFMTTFPYMSGDVVVYAYGMKDLNSRASANYGNYSVSTGQDIASLFMGRDLSFNDYRFTETRGVILFTGNDVVNDLASDQIQVWVTASGPGSVTGAGTYTMGTEVNLVATPNAGCNFICWRMNGSGFVLSYNQTIKLYPRQNVDLIAVFENPESSTGGWNGSEETNPLPGAEAEIIFDGTTKAIEAGVIELESTFDNLSINNIGDDYDVTYVPAGSSLGAADNITLEPNAGENADYWMSATNTGSGAIYLDNNLWFYIVATSTFAITFVNGQTAEIGGTYDVPFNTPIVIEGTGLSGSWHTSGDVQPASISDSRVRFNGFASIVPHPIYRNGVQVLTINTTQE